MKFQVITTLFLFLALIRSQEVPEYEDYDYEEEDEGLQPSLLAPLATGVFAFFSYLGVTMIQRQSWTPLEDYPGCGELEYDLKKRQFFETRLPGDLCDTNCTWKPYDLELVNNLIIDIDGAPKIRLNLDIERVPVDTSCLDNCKYSQPYSTRTSNCFDRKGLRKFECIIFDGAEIWSEKDEADDSDKVKPRAAFIPRREDERLMVYCLAEQNITSSDELSELQEKGLTSKSESTFCKQLFSLPPNERKKKKNMKNRSTKLQLHKSKGSKRKSHRQARATGGLPILDNSVASVSDTESPLYGLLYDGTRAPWHCSLRLVGFRGNHRCGVTLLSVKDEDKKFLSHKVSDKNILVSAAHCNQVCKEIYTGRVLETCCCRSGPDSCIEQKKSSYCGRPHLVTANPKDFQIVCGEFSIEQVPENISEEEEIIFDIKEIVNHPKFNPTKPALGYDIAIYHVYDYENRGRNKTISDIIRKRKINPACLPRERTEYERQDKLKGYFFGWNDPEPTFRTALKTLDDYKRANFVPQSSYLQETNCSDPDWMRSNTSYPKSTICFNDPSVKGCVAFGNSGSPMVLPIKYQPTNNNLQLPKFAFVGPLSFSKGCDRTLIWKPNKNLTFTRTTPRGENPAVFTDAICYMDWIAEQYEHKPPVKWKKPEYCETEYGDKNDEEKDYCMSSSDYRCDFSNSMWNKCKLTQFEGFSYNWYRCMDTNGNEANCANNCKGADANAVVVGGLAVGYFSATAASMVFVPPAGLAYGGAGLLGMMGMGMMANRGCPRTQCRPRGSQSCCNRGRRGRCSRVCNAVQA